MHELKKLEKKAQVWGYYAPAHGSLSDEANGVKSMAKGLAKPFTAASGAVIGAMQQYGDAVGRGALPVPDMDGAWGGLVHRNTGDAAAAAEQIATGAGVGASVGWRDVDRVASDAKVTAARVASNFGLVGDDKVLALQRENDKKILEQIGRANSEGDYKFPVPENPPKDRDGLLVPVTTPDGSEDPRYSEYNSYINWARGGQGVADTALTSAVDWKASGLLGRGGKAVGGKIVKSVKPKAVPISASPREKAMALLNYKMNPAPTGWRKAVPVATATTAGSAPSLIWRVKSDARDAENERRDASEQFSAIAENVRGMDPSSEEYKNAYDELKLSRDLNPSAFDSLPAPTYRSQPEPQAASQTEPRAAEHAPQNGWAMSPELQDLIGYGLGGSLLGGIFGGKGSWWKLGLLGLLLGALKNGGGGLGNLWNNITRGQGQAAK